MERVPGECAVRDEQAQAVRRALAEGCRWQLSVAFERRGGERARLSGDEIEDVPDIAADAFAIAFGDFRRGYLIVDRQGARVLRDPYSLKPYMLFHTTKRAGGGVQNFDTIKVIKVAAS